MVGWIRKVMNFCWALRVQGTQQWLQVHYIDHICLSVCLFVCCHFTSIRQMLTQKRQLWIFFLFYTRNLSNQIGWCIHSHNYWMDVEPSPLSTPKVAWICIFSSWFSQYFLWFWEGEFDFLQSGALLGKDHFLYSHNVNVWFSCNNEGRN